MDYFVYILSNDAGTALYTGVTNDLSRRIEEHRSGVVPGFAVRYQTHRLVYYELFDRAYEAITREKQIKGGSRTRKLALIRAMNPEWRDLVQDL